MPRKTVNNNTTKESKAVSSSKAKNSTNTFARSSQKQPVNSQDSEKATGGRRAIRVHRSSIIVALVIILLGVLLYFGRGFIIAAVVNGQPISRFSLIQETEKASGRQALASLIRNALVEQEARKQNVTISEKQINDQIKTIENNLSKQGQKIDQMLALEGMTRDDLRRIIRLDLLVTKLIEKDIKITDKQVNDYIEKNKETLPKDKSEAQLKKEVAEQLKKEQLPQKAQAWFAELEKKANIMKFVDY